MSMKKDINNSPETFEKQSQIKMIFRRFCKNRLALVGLGIILTLITLCLFAEQIAPYDTGINMNLREKLQGPSMAHPLGTDAFGRDLLSRCLHGGKVSLVIGISASLLSLLLGGTIGLVSAYYGGRVDNVIMRVMDIIAAIPTILLALTILAALGASLQNMIIALAVSRISAFARVVRASVMTITGQEYVEAARVGGVSDMRIMFRHVLPNAMGPLIVQTTMNVASMILNAATLSFLGLGVTAPQPEWGAIINEGKDYLRAAPYLIMFPGFMIILSSLSMNLIGDGIRDAMDPKLKD